MPTSIRSAPPGAGDIELALEDIARADADCIGALTCGRSNFSYHRLPEPRLRLTIRKLDASYLDVQIARSAAVWELKAAIESLFIALYDDTEKAISWQHVWSHFCLCFKDEKLTDDKATLRAFGIRDGDELHFAQHLSVNYSPCKCLSKNHKAASHRSCFGEGSICCSSVVESVRHNITISSTSITSFMAVLQLRCLNISGQTMASLFRVLHAILKFLKHSDCELKCDFICLSIHHIQKIRWDSYYQLNARQLVSLVKDGRFSLSNDSAQLGILSGSLLQLLCSLVEQSDLEDTDGRHMYAKLVDVIPTLAAFLQEQHDVPKSLSQYSKHKILMVMMRLKPYMQQERCC